MKGKQVKGSGLKLFWVVAYGRWWVERCLIWLIQYFRCSPMRAFRIPLRWANEKYQRERVGRRVRVVERTYWHSLSGGNRHTDKEIPQTEQDLNS